VAASATLLLEGGAQKQALVLASREDMDNGHAEVLLEEGQALPVDPTPPKKGSDDKAAEPPAPIKGIGFYPGRDDPLWTAAN
jgi:hypothetical protein